MRAFGFFGVFLLVLLPLTGYAACEGPPAEMGVIIFNKAHKVMQYCNGDDWIGLWGSGGGSGAQRISGEVASFALPACPEGWSEYLPARGRFIRGVDPSGTNDAVRAIGNVQADALGSHTHTGTAASAGGHTHTGTTNVAGDHTHSLSGRGDNNAHYQFGAQLSAQNNITTSGAINAAGAHSHSLTTNNAGDHTHSLSILATGAAETRPKNVSLLYCIKD